MGSGHIITDEAFTTRGAIAKKQIRYPDPPPEKVTLSQPQPASSTDAYADRRQQEIQKFTAVENVHELPEIFHFWSNRYVRPKIEAVLGVSTIDDFFLKYIKRSLYAHPSDLVVIVSIGAGNSDTELRLAQKMRDEGLKNFLFRCLDINPSMLDRGRQFAATNGLSNQFEFVESDVTSWKERGNVSIVMANHSLHHIVELETLFERVRTAIGTEGYFLVCDMVGAERTHAVAGSTRDHPFHMEDNARSLQIQSPTQALRRTIRELGLFHGRL